ncbi:MAG: hypothetical protein RID07_13420, partial [Lacipirellulaceae bacterium]
LESLGIESGTYELTGLRQAPVRWLSEEDGNTDSSEPESLILLKLLWDEPSRDLLVTLVEEASQTATVVDPDSDPRTTDGEQP